jgi:alpha-galactosidase/6-phospho-beta-glucosidase family protein
MDLKIIDIVRNTFDLSDELIELKDEIERADNFSAEKLQLQYMLAQICANEAASTKDRQDAARILIHNSDLRAAIQSVPDYKMLIDEMIQAVKNGSVRH